MYGNCFTFFLCAYYVTATAEQGNLCIEETGEFCDWSTDLATRFQWQPARYQSDPSGNTGPIGDTSLSTSGYYLLADATDDTYNKYIKMSSKSFPFKQGETDTFCVDFQYFMYGRDIGMLKFEFVCTDSETNKTVKENIKLNTTTTNQWRRNRQKISLSELGYSGVIQFLITAKMGRGHYGDIAIDNIHITNKECMNAIDEESETTYADKKAGNLTLDMFIFHLQTIESKYPHFTSREIANKLRIVAGYNDENWKKMIFGYFYRNGDVVGPFEKTSGDEEIYSELKSMMQHGMDGTNEVGVLKNHNETIAFGHVITGITAGYDRKTVPPVVGLDNLFAATISGDLGQSGLGNSKDPSSPIIGPKGNWSNGQYDLGTDKAGEATYAEVIGDIDGFNLGHIVAKNKTKLLSEHLKEYYGEKSSKRFELFLRYTDVKTLKAETGQFIAFYSGHTFQGIFDISQKHMEMAKDALCVFYGVFLELKTDLGGSKESEAAYADKVAGHLTLDMFIFYLQTIESQYPNLTPREIANKLRIVAGYNDDKWKTMIFGVLQHGVIGPFEYTIASLKMLCELRPMMQHRMQGKNEVGVVKNHEETIAFGHVITGITAGYDRKKVPRVFGVDNLFAATISGDLGQSVLETSKDPTSPIIGPKGTWSNGQYDLGTEKAGEATFAEIIGDIDGFNLGYIVAKDKTKLLSEHLKEYYREKSSKRFELFQNYTDVETLKAEVGQFIAMYSGHKWQGMIYISEEQEKIAKEAISAFCRNVPGLKTDWCRSKE